MAEKEEIIAEKFDYSGIFHFSEYYAFAHKWLKNEDYDVVEEKYSENVSGNSRSIYIEWKATKQVSDYFKIEIKMKFDLKDLVDVEVEIDGKKKKMHKGRVAMDMKGNLVKDPESKWEGTAFNRFLREIYNKYIIPSRLEGIKIKIRADTRSFKEELKAYLELLGKR